MSGQRLLLKQNQFRKNNGYAHISKKKKKKKKAVDCVLECNLRSRRQ